MKKISVIIPVLNEMLTIGKLLEYLLKISSKHQVEILVIDGGSTDETLNIVKEKNVAFHLSPKKGRAAQMNYGAKLATGNILHFIHADTFPPESCFDDVIETIEKGYDLGCFTYCFNSRRLLLKINSYFTKFDKLWCRGGDQTLFIKKEVFEALNGFRNDYLIMEDFDIIVRARNKYSFKIVKKNAIISARKYEKNNYLKVQLANLIVFNMYRLGYSQQKMVSVYTKMLR